MLKIGQVMGNLSKKGVVYVEDVYEDRAVRLVKSGKNIEAYIKRKGESEVVSLYSGDIILETIHELHNKEVSVEEYNN